jgi:hypothetical protein
MNKKDYLNENFIQVLEKKTWSTEKANKWYSELPWLVGCNYIPNNAINQLEMFQKKTFDPKQIEKELNWAEELGFNALRVYLHFLLWQDNFTELKKKIDQFLQICKRHNMKVLFVLFDDCWNQDPHIGAQPEPIPGVHNSGWLASPGRKRVLDEKYYPELKNYTQDVISYYAEEDLVLGWDLYNEPGNMNMRDKSLPLVIASFSWAREIDPSQPLTVGLWQFNFKSRVWKDLEKVCINCSDIITFHDYQKIEKTIGHIKYLKELKRPILCTEYMARTLNSLFQTHLPVFKKEKIGAFNWGLVSGKTQTIYNWLSKEGDPIPELWFHDIFYEDGTPFSIEEVEFIKSIIKD